MRDIFAKRILQGNQSWATSPGWMVVLAFFQVALVAGCSSSSNLSYAPPVAPATPNPTPTPLSIPSSAPTPIAVTTPAPSPSPFPSPLPIILPTISSVNPVVLTPAIGATLNWNSVDDLDLAVTDPFGQTVSFSNKQVASGGQLTIDSNGGCFNTTSRGVENAFWPAGAPAGTYTVRVNLFARCPGGVASGSIPFTLTVTRNGVSTAFTGSVNTGSDVVIPLIYP